VAHPNLPLDAARRRALIASADAAAAELAARHRFTALGLLLRMQALADQIVGLPPARSSEAQHLGFVLREMNAATRSSAARARVEYDALCGHFEAVEALCDEYLGPREPPAPSEDDNRRLPRAARPLCAFMLGVARQAELVRSAEHADTAALDAALAINAARLRAGRAHLVPAGALEGALDAWLAFLDGF